MMEESRYRIAVVIPCFRVRAQILDVLAQMGSECWRIYVVDDACPEKTGLLVTEQVGDPRVKVLFHENNQGVGGAVMTGYRQAIADGAQIIVKIDGDGQHAPSLIPEFCAPLIQGEADYTKGNRFYDLEDLQDMPGARIFGNAVLSLFSKLSTGYWDIFDPTNGYTAIRAEIAGKLPFRKISKRYFFESDMLFRLNLLHAVVVDIPMSACYAGEKSNLKINGIIGEFLLKHARNLGKRIFYNYFLRDMSLASLELLTGGLLISFGTAFGLSRWFLSAQAGVTTPAGTVMLAALPIMLGLQFLLAFFGYDIATLPRHPRSPALNKPLASRQLIDDDIR
jgi:glycosyltransferase involved in cell wall biosynthesis